MNTSELNKRIAEMLNKSLHKNLDLPQAGYVRHTILALTPTLINHPVVKASYRDGLAVGGPVDDLSMMLADIEQHPQLTKVSSLVSPVFLQSISLDFFNAVAFQCFTRKVPDDHVDLVIANYLGVDVAEWLACKKDDDPSCVAEPENEENPMKLTPKGTRCLTDLLQQALHRSLSIPKGSSIQCYTQHLTPEQFKHPIVRAAIRHMLVYVGDDYIVLNEATGYPLAYDHCSKTPLTLQEISNSLYSLVSSEFPSSPNLIIACYLGIGLMGVACLQEKARSSRRC